MKLYVKKVAREWEGQFKVGDDLPEVSDQVGTALVSAGLATATKPKADVKNKPTKKASK